MAEAFKAGWLCLLKDDSMMGDDRNVPSEGRRGCVMVLSNGNGRSSRRGERVCGNDEMRMKSDKG